MRFDILTSALVFGSGVSAQLSSTINQQCFTRYSTVRPRTLQTTNYDTKTTQTATRFVTITPRVTVTPAEITSTVKTIKTNTGSVTLDTTTDTYTRTRTTTQTGTETETESFTQTTTSTTVVTISSTTTVAAPAGFTGLRNWPGYFPKREAVAERREAIVQERAAATTNFLLPTIAPAAKKIDARQAQNTRVQYPFGVRCTRSITYFSTRTSTRTAARATSTLPTPTAWVTNTEFATRTITVIPADETSIVSLTLHATSTSTSTVSTTSTVTNTNTVFAPSATFLAQCDQTANMISSAVGQKIGTISYNPRFVLQGIYLSDKTGYGCCVQCANSANCAGYAQAPASTGGQCYYLISDGRCDNQQSFGNVFRYYNTDGMGYMVGNGQCGFLGATAGPAPMS